MAKEIKNYGKSVRTRLLSIAKTEQYDYQLLLARYAQERFLYRLSKSAYRDNLVLKGGALLYVDNQLKARPTLDIDFMASRVDNDAENIKNIVGSICQITCEEDGVEFDATNITAVDIAQKREYHGISITLVAKIDSIRQPLSMDFGFGDVMTPHPVDITYPTLLSEEPEVNIKAYSLENVVAEKFQTMIERSVYNSRMKDFLDVYDILKNRDIDKDILGKAIKATFENRNTPYIPNHPIFTADFYEDRSKISQ